MTPMKPVPFKIVYMMGLGEKDFPRHSDKSTLDLRNAKKLQGDLTNSENDNYLFMELLLATRCKLYLSYVSRDLEKDQEQYPSPVLTQLMREIKSWNKDFNIAQTDILWESMDNLKVPLSDFSKQSANDIFGCHNDYRRKIGYAFLSSNENKNDNHKKTYDTYPNVSFSDLCTKLFSDNEKKAAKILSEITTEKISENLNSYKKLEKSESPKNLEEISLYDLEQFLKNPAEERIRNTLSINKQVDFITKDSRYEKEYEDFAGEEHYYESSTVEELHWQYLCSKNNSDYIQQKFHNAQMNGLFPEAVFGDLLNKKYSVSIEDTFSELKEKTEEIIAQIGKISYSGEINFHPGKERTWSRLNAAYKNIPLVGKWRHCLVSEESRLIALVLPGLRENNHHCFLQLLKAFLFAGFLMQHKATSQFTVKVFWFTNNYSLNYFEPQRSQAATFLTELVTEYIMDCDYDLLPIEAVFKNMPVINDNDGYADILEKEINKAAYNSLSIAEKLPVSLKLSNLQVPPDARDKVLRRFWKNIPESLKLHFL